MYCKCYASLSVCHPLCYGLKYWIHFWAALSQDYLTQIWGWSDKLSRMSWKKLENSHHKRKLQFWPLGGTSRFEINNSNINTDILKDDIKQTNKQNIQTCDAFYIWRLQQVCKRGWTQVKKQWHKARIQHLDLLW